MNSVKKNLIRPKEVAARLGVSIRTVYRLLSGGALTRVKVLNCTGVAESELRAYIERQKQRCG